MMMLRILWTSVLVLCVSAGVSRVAAAPEAEAWTYWATHDQSSQAQIDHKVWNTILQQVVFRDKNGINRVDYARLKTRWHRELTSYLEDMQSVTVTRLNRDQQFAYWVNLYNALTVKVIADHHPVRSIKDIDISPGFFSDGPWGAELLKIEGHSLSLDDIEHRILRPLWRDPRIHYAVNCASVGCPNLATSAYVAGKLENQLDRAAQAFINHPRAVTEANGRLIASKIYSWFEEDFGKDSADVIAHLKRYAEPDLAQTLSRADTISSYRYDWSLNDRKPAGSTSGRGFYDGRRGS
ncbi:DUF547 domain-containing protein [Coralliovum pocilloporae]|uniref:DUF547 domain-containing protein n=1 Tax=Coralliovum pocilloporae TaxID=3066369 RepID=UPI003306BF84